MGSEALYHEGTLFASRSRAGPYGATLSFWCSSRGSFAFSALVFEEEDAYPRERQSFKTLRLRSTQEASPANFALKLSEKSRRRVKRGLPGHRSGTVRPVSAPIYRPNPRSERCSYPFSDSFFTEFCEVHA
jgi:hypothetical protein